MRKVKLTKLESRVMDVLWNTDEKLAISDIQKVLTDLSVYSIRQVIHKLEDKGFVKALGYSENRYGIMRTYGAVLAQEEYLRDTISDKSILSLASGFVQRSQDYDALQKLSDLLNERMKELQEQNNA